MSDTNNNKRKWSASTPESGRMRSGNLNPYLIAEIATFLDIANTRTNDSGVDDNTTNSSRRNNHAFNLCIAVGSGIADIVRQVYLRNNDWYLIHSLVLGLPQKVPGSTSFEAKQNKRRARERRGCSKRNILDWIGVNQDWEDRIDIQRYQGDPDYFPSTDTCREGCLVTKVTIPTILFLTHGFPFRFHGILFLKHSGPFVAYAGAHVESVETEWKKKYEICKGDILLAADGRNLVGMPTRRVREILDECSTRGDWTELKFMRSPNVLFSNPAVATAYGLTKVVKALVEDYGINVNDDQSFGGNLERSLPTSLLWVSFDSSPDIETFRYLLTVPGIDCMDLAGGDEHSLTFQPPLLYLACACENQHMTLSDFKALIHNPSVNVNTLPMGYVTPLNRLLLTGLRCDIKLEIVKSLLQAGADPRGIVRPGHHTPVDLVQSWIQEGKPHRKVWEEILEVLEEAISSFGSGD